MVIGGIDDSLATISKADYFDLTSDDDATEALAFAAQADIDVYIANLESDMRESAKKSKFERLPNSETGKRTVDERVPFRLTTYLM
jgi:excinuclease ABC subunit B